ncbi:MAG TPA: nucleotidyltransferase domain-containing protein [Ignavibacteriaceae bacterium]|nr:nucleotidyltransferase domain-containing protein [Ignavibacteriaceae bacterium]
MTNHHLIAKELKENLENNLPGLIQRVILYGSYIKGKANENSDLDFLLLLNNDIDWETKRVIYDISNNINIKYDVWVDINWISKNDLNSLRGKQPFVQNALAEGITV